MHQPVREHFNILGVIGVLLKVISHVLRELVGPVQGARELGRGPEYSVVGHVVGSSYVGVVPVVQDVHSASVSWVSGGGAAGAVRIVGEEVFQVCREEARFDPQIDEVLRLEAGVGPLYVELSCKGEICVSENGLDRSACSTTGEGGRWGL